MGKLSLWKTIFLLCAFCAATAIASPAQAGCSAAAPCFKSLVSFNGADGGTPGTVLVQGTDGNFYGIAGGGGTNGCGYASCGTVFKLNPKTDTLTTLYNFCIQTNCTDGYFPAGLVLAASGNLYGTTSWGGTGVNASCSGNGQFGCGTIFKITTSGTLTTLYSLNGSEGSSPSDLVQGTDGNFYGTTSQGGANNAGTVFKFNPKTDTLTTLYNFCAQSNCTDGTIPTGTLVQASDGYFYGTTWEGGTYGLGTVFKIIASGTLTTLHSFDGTNGSDLPGSGVVAATDGKLYGTTVNNPSGSGTVFQMTRLGALTTLQTFVGANGLYPYAGLVEATDGNLYGTTYFGGAATPNCPTLVGNLSCGSVFKITFGGILTTLYSFCPQTPCTDGAAPLAALMQATNGSFYGTTSGGGVYGVGTIFSLSVGLGPFVETLPTAGKVGTAVTILGNNLTGSTGVTFNGTAATFTVNSTGTAITTTVPSGATTGRVKVTTPSRTLTSTVNFRVMPTIASPL